MVKADSASADEGDVVRVAKAASCLLFVNAINASKV
jgi:hypothetical protein